LGNKIIKLQSATKMRIPEDHKHAAHQPQEPSLPNQEPESDNIAYVMHRGFGANQTNPDYPENSLASFRAALDAGTDFIEFDLNLSRDEKLMVVHDKADISVNGEVCSAGKVVSQYDAQSLQEPGLVDVSCGRPYKGKVGGKYDKPDYEIIPRLFDVLKLVSEKNALRVEEGLPKIKLNIELKGGQYRYIYTRGDKEV
jgi:glycerophosphoryl diester phosphodiesterase